MKQQFHKFIPLLISPLIIISCTNEEKTILVSTDNQAPTVRILSPSPGDTLKGLVDIQAEASDDKGIARVEFYIDGALPDSQAVIEEAPYLYIWDTQSVSDGSHLISARAYDLSENYGDAISVLAQVDNSNLEPDTQPPTVMIVLPEPGDSLRGIIDIEAEASDDYGIARVEFYIDGALPDSLAVDEEAPYLYTWDTQTTTDGSHLIFVRAYDLSENCGDAIPVLVLVDNINENAPCTIYVPGDYPTIQQGVNAAKDGDTVLVGPGIYHEDFNFKGKSIWVKSEDGPAETIWEGLNQDLFTKINSGEDTSSVLCGFKISNAYEGISIDWNCSPKITNCIIVNMDYTGILTHTSNAIITNNTIFNCQHGMQIAGICLVKNNIVASGSGYGLGNAQLSPQYAPIGDYNNVWDWGLGNYNDRWIVGEHDISVDPMFQDTLEFRLQPESPCIDAGDPSILDPNGTRSDIGAWGGPHAYE